MRDGPVTVCDDLLVETADVTLGDRVIGLTELESLAERPGWLDAHPEWKRLLDDFHEAAALYGEPPGHRDRVGIQVAAACLDGTCEHRG